MYTKCTQRCLDVAVELEFLVFAELRAFNLRAMQLSPDHFQFHSK